MDIKDWSDEIEPLTLSHGFASQPLIKNIEPFILLKCSRAYNFVEHIARRTHFELKVSRLRDQ